MPLLLVIKVWRKKIRANNVPSEDRSIFRKPKKSGTKGKPVLNITKRIHTLGSVRHRHEHTGEIILIPTPSKDPNDPLNWYVSPHLKSYTDLPLT